MACAKCGWEQQDGLDECAKCGVIFSKIIEETSTNPPKAEKTNHLKVVSIYLLIAFFSMVLYSSMSAIGSMLVTPEKPKLPWHKIDASAEASIMMQDFVKDRLKAPSTASFKPGYSDSVTRLEGQKYRVEAWVDAQNGFGAKIRNFYIGEIEQIKKDSWELRSLEFSKN